VKYQIIVLPQAKQDAQDIDNYRSARNPAAADRFWKNLQGTLELQASISTPGIAWVSENPATASLRWTRVKGFRNYLVFLRVVGRAMEVVRILHGARDLEPLLGGSP
jgi:toxin ParE1/3/4